MFAPLVPDPLRDLPLLVRLPSKLQEAHVLAAPSALLVELGDLGHGLLLHARPGRPQLFHGSTVAAGREGLGRKVEPHLRLAGLVVEEHPAGHGERRGLIC